MIIWSGYGFLVPIIAFACLLAAEFVSEAVFHDGNYYQEHAWPMALGFMVAGVVVAAAAHRFRGAEPRVMLDEETGERVMVGGSKHSFFFVPIRYWSGILFMIGVLVTLFPLTES